MSQQGARGLPDDTWWTEVDVERLCRLFGRRRARAGERAQRALLRQEFSVEPEGMTRAEAVAILGSDVVAEVERRAAETPPMSPETADRVAAILLAADGHDGRYRTA